MIGAITESRQYFSLPSTLAVHIWQKVCKEHYYAGPPPSFETAIKLGTIPSSGISLEIKRYQSRFTSLYTKRLSMATPILPPWIPANLTEFAPTNCSLASSFYAQAQIYEDAPIQKTIEVLINGLQKYWIANNVTIPSPGEIAAFVVDELLALNNTFAQNIASAVGGFVGQDCLTDYCRVLPWQGNADLSGRGASRLTIKLF